MWPARLNNHLHANPNTLAVIGHCIVYIVCSGIFSLDQINNWTYKGTVCCIVDMYSTIPENIHTPYGRH